jgi:hypothetical protein
MADFGVIQHSIGVISVDDKTYNVSLRLAYDGVEYIGRLWFADAATEGIGIPDHGAVPGRSVDEALELARRLTPDDLKRRCHRALAEKRRYIRLRRATEDIIVNIKYMNRVAVNMRNGMLDAEGASQELEMIRRQIEEIVKTLPSHAGVEG